MVSAVSVCSFARPRAPSATETLAIVAASGASTTLTKSNGPSVAHWCRTRAPSSSTSLLTSRSRAGFDLSVWTPCAVRLDSRMYVGIAPPPSGRRAYTRELVVIKERAAEEEQWRDDENGDERRRAQSSRAGGTEREEEDVRGQQPDERERRERADRMREIGASKLENAGVRAAPLERDHRNDQSGEPEPEHGGQQPEDPEQAEQDDRGNQCDRSKRGGFREPPTRNPLSRDDTRREGEREARRDRRHRQCQRQPRDPGRLGDSQARRGGSDTQGERTPETAP